MWGGARLCGGSGPIWVRPGWAGPDGAGLGSPFFYGTFFSDLFFGTFISSFFFESHISTLKIKKVGVRVYQA